MKKENTNFLHSFLSLTFSSTVIDMPVNTIIQFCTTEDQNAPGYITASGVVCKHLHISVIFMCGKNVTVLKICNILCPTAILTYETLTFFSQIAWIFFSLKWCIKVEVFLSWQRIF